MAFTSIENLYRHFLEQQQLVTTDTRKIVPGSLFFALKGPNFNGNGFAQAALEAGASWAIVDEPAFAINERTLLVPDVLEALQRLALHHRRQFHIPFIGITGSNGKTTTKELVHTVLGTTFTTYTTEGNLNNHIGIPLTLLRVHSDAQIAVIEMGANHQGEIASYCTYAEPTHGLITNCGKAHLEGFGGIEGVRKGKGELFDHLRQNNGQVWACHDFDYFHSMISDRMLQLVTWYGLDGGNIRGRVLESEPFLNLEVYLPDGQQGTVKTQLVGNYNAYNVLAAISVGHHFGIDLPKMAQAIAGYAPSNSRSQLMEKDGNHIILDAYNANPTSMAAAIQNFAGLHMPNKMLFLGGMMEMGESSMEEHQRIIDLISQYPWAQVVLVGGDFGKTPHPFLYFDTSSEAASWWKANRSTGNSLLVKGSRSMQMEKLIQD